MGSRRTPCTVCGAPGHEWRGTRAPCTAATFVLCDRAECRDTAAARSLPGLVWEGLPAWGILFRDDMIRAIRSGRKRVTRRMQPRWAVCGAGRRLWAKECWAPVYDEGRGTYTEYRADGDPGRLPGPAELHDDPCCPRWRSSLLMPRRFARIEMVTASVTRIDQRLPERWTPAEVAFSVGVDSVAEAEREGFASFEDFGRAWMSMHPTIGTVWRIAW